MSLLQEAKRHVANQLSKSHLNAFINRLDQTATLKAVESIQAGNHVGALSGRLVAVKDNICTSDLPTTAASSILKTFTSPYDATVVSQLRNAGAVVTGKTNLDEFGMGSHSVHSHFHPVKQETLGEALSAGGSSGGSAVAVATDQCWAALGTDTGGSVRLPAAFTGVVGYKPTYGMLSRWGVIAYANSLDTVGILARSVRDVREVFDVLSQFDENDPTSLPEDVRATIRTVEEQTSPTGNIRIGIPAEYNLEELDPTVREAWLRSARALGDFAKLQNKNVSFHRVSLPTTKQALSAYYILAPAEASSNLAKYDGIRYGSRTTKHNSDAADGTVLFSETRGEHFGAEVRRRVLLGTYSLSAAAVDNFFVQAQKVRRLVQRDFDGVFACRHPLQDGADDGGRRDGQGVDVILHPTAPTPPLPLADVFASDESGEASTLRALREYTNDVFTVPASLAGLPTISIPVPYRNEVGETSNCGMQIVGQFGADQQVLRIAEMLEAALSYENTT